MLNHIEDALELADLLEETKPHAIFSLVSSLNIPYIYNRRFKMLDEAKRLYANGELIKDGSRRRTLGSCWFVQVSKLHWRMSQKIRRYYRESTGTARAQVPAEFLEKIAE